MDMLLNTWHDVSLSFSHAMQRSYLLTSIISNGGGKKQQREGQNNRSKNRKDALYFSKARILQRKLQIHLQAIQQ